MTTHPEPKQRMVTVIDDELAALLAYGPEDLGAPTLYRCGAEWKADAGELRKWRASQATSEVAK